MSGGSPALLTMSPWRRKAGIQILAVLALLMGLTLWSALSEAMGQTLPTDGSETPLLEAEGGESVVNPEEEGERPTPLLSDRFLPGSRTIIPREKFSDTQQTVADVLEVVPGVALTRSGDAMSSTQVRIRGSRPDQVLILVDGVPVQGGGDSPSQRRRENRAGLDLATLSLSQVESIEVVRGAASGLYGPGAAAGAVLIRTRQRVDPAVEVSATVGSGEYREGDVQWTLLRSGGGRADDVFTLHLNHRESEGNYIFYDSEAAQSTQTTPGNNPCAKDLGGGYFERGCNESRFTTLNSEWRREELKLGLFLEESLRQGLLGIENQQPFGREDGRRIRLTYKDRLKFPTAPDDVGEASALFHDGHMERYRATREEGADSPAHRFTDDRVGLNAGWEEWRASHRLILAGGGSGQWLNDDRFDAERTILSARGEWSYHREHGTWEAALRYEALSDLGNETTWRAALAEALWEGIGLKGSHGTGYRPPSLYELYDPGSLAGSAPASVANPGLLPERTRSSDLGVFLEREETLYLEWMAFRHDSENTIVAVPAAENPNLLRFENVTRTRSTGSETSLSLRWGGGWSLDAGWTRTDAIIVDNGGGDPREIGNRLPGIPRDRYTLSTAWRGGGWHPWLQSRHQGAQFIDTANTRYLKAYTLVDAGITIPITASWEVSLTGRNLTNITYAELDNYPPPGRQGFLTLRWKTGASAGKETIGRGKGEGSPAPGTPAH